eukprot:2435145-Prorocentrum_lima.AAC.1
MLENSNAFYRGEDSLTAPTHTLFMDDILRPLDSDDLEMCMEIFAPTIGTGVGHVLSAIEALSALP